MKRGSPCDCCGGRGFNVTSLGRHRCLWCDFHVYALGRRAIFHLTVDNVAAPVYELADVFWGIILQPEGGDG